MRTRLLAVGVILLACADPLAAAKIPPEFRAAFEAPYRKGQTYGVVLQSGIPAMTVHGPNNSYLDGYYAIDIVEGDWKTAREIDELVTDYLEKGEVMQLASVSYRDNRIDLRMVALDPRRVRREGRFGLEDKFEEVATKFNFSLPFEKSRTLTPADLPAVQKYIEAYLKVFPTESAARAFSAKLRAAALGSARAEPGSRSPATPAGGARKREIKPGMTTQEVIAILGKPQKEVTFATSARWSYPDLTVIFENGRVKDVRF